nr:BAG family molecular chaperone regulator 4 [Tanacetum cinerariifolium]
MNLEAKDQRLLFKGKKGDGERLDMAGVEEINGIKIPFKEIEVLTELLMKELLTLYGVEAEGEAKIQRRIETGLSCPGIRGHS